MEEYKKQLENLNEYIIEMLKEQFELISKLEAQLRLLEIRLENIGND